MRVGGGHGAPAAASRRARELDDGAREQAEAPRVAVRVLDVLAVGAEARVDAGDLEEQELHAVIERDGGDVDRGGGAAGRVRRGRLPPGRGVDGDALVAAVAGRRDGDVVAGAREGLREARDAVGDAADFTTGAIAG